MPTTPRKHPHSGTNPMTWGQGSTRAWRKARAEVLERDHHQCQLNYPCCIRYANEVDHITNLASINTSRRDEVIKVENLQAVCRPCHQVKTNREAKAGQTDWRRPAERHPGLK